MMTKKGSDKTEFGPSDNTTTMMAITTARQK
jgi:hypothetical protein